MLTNHPIARTDIRLSVDYFATWLLRATDMRECRRYIARYGRALAGCKRPTERDCNLFLVSWRAVRRQMGPAGYEVELARLHQLYGLTEHEYREEIARTYARMHRQRRWSRENVRLRRAAGETVASAIEETEG